MVRSSDRPITSAATSMSRTAIQPRPTLPRAMFLASSASTATITSTTQYFSRGLAKLWPNITIFWAVMTPAGS